MDFFGGIDSFGERGSKGCVTVGLHTSKPLAHEYAAPLFRGGVSHMHLTERHAYVGGGDYPSLHSVLILMEGRLAVNLDSRRKRVMEPGMVCVMPAGTYMKRVTVTDTARWIFFHIRDEPEWKPLKRKSGRVREYEFTDCIHSLATQVIRSYYSDTATDRYSACALSNAILEILKYELMILDDLPSGRSAEVESLFELIRESPGDNWTLERMVKETGMPIRTLTRHCRRVFGAAPLELVIRQRLRVACELLAGPEKLSLDEVGTRLGYSSGASFSTVFTRHMDMRPGEYRRYERGPE